MASLGVLEVSDATFETEVLQSEQPVLLICRFVAGGTRLDASQSK